MPSVRLVLVLFFVICFSVAARLEPWFQAWSQQRNRSGSVLTALMGDSRRLFANHFFTKADVYFHSGYYPSVFDKKKLHGPEEEDHGSSETEHKHDEHCDHDNHTEESADDHSMNDILGEPRDWID